MCWRRLEECPVEVQAKRVSWRLFMALCMGQFEIAGPLPPCTKSLRGCSVRTGWGGTAKASCEFFVISTALRVKPVWGRRDHQNWRCIALDKLSAVELLEGPWRTAANHSRPASFIIR